MTQDALFTSMSPKHLQWPSGISGQLFIQAQSPLLNFGAQPSIVCETTITSDVCDLRHTIQLSLPPGLFTRFVRFSSAFPWEWSPWAVFPYLGYILWLPKLDDHLFYNQCWQISRILHKKCIQEASCNALMCGMYLGPPQHWTKMTSETTDHEKARIRFVIHHPQRLAHKHPARPWLRR